MWQLQCHSRSDWESPQAWSRSLSLPEIRLEDLYFLTRQLCALQEEAHQNGSPSSGHSASRFRDAGKQGEEPPPGPCDPELRSPISGGGCCTRRAGKHVLVTSWSRHSVRPVSNAAVNRQMRQQRPAKGMVTWAYIVQVMRAWVALPVRPLRRAETQVKGETDPERSGEERRGEGQRGRGEGGGGRLQQQKQ